MISKWLIRILILLFNFTDSPDSSTGLQSGKQTEEFQVHHCYTNVDKTHVSDLVVHRKFDDF